MIDKINIILIKSENLEHHGEKKGIFQMKKRRIIYAGAFLLVFISFTMAENQFRIGIKTSFAISGHWSPKEKGEGYSVESGIKNGFLTGILVNYNLNDVFQLQTEIYYVKKGSTQDVTIASIPIGEIYVIYKLDYIEIPLLLKTYPFKQKGKIRPNMSIGPYVAFLVKSQYSFRNIFIGELEQKIEDIGRIDAGVVFGSGFDFVSDAMTVGVIYKFSMGFVDLALPTGPGFPAIELRNNCHMLTLEVVF